MDAIGSNTLAIGLVVVLLLSAVMVVAAASRPHTVLYALAATVSLVGINVHLGVTLYLSRAFILLFLVSMLIRAAVGKRVRLPSRFFFPFLVLFALILCFQVVSVLLSGQVVDGLRQLSIYVSAMAVFLVVLFLSDDKAATIKSIKVYLVTGFVQGLYGVYQMVGNPFGWPTYQTLLAGIPTANDRTVDGYVYSSLYRAFRASGFFPADVSHYAGYMAGVLVLAIALMVHNRRSVLPYVVLVFGLMGLVFSLSRSGILAFVVFGLPSLFFLLSRIRPVARVLYRSLAIPGLLALILLGVVGPIVLSSYDIDLPNPAEIISARLDDVLNPRENSGESMDEHVMTRLTGLDAMASSPLIGVGLGVNASPWYSERYQRGWAGSHSHHIDVLGQTGLIGGALQFLLMAIVGTYMWRGLLAKRDRSVERHVLAGILAAYIAILMGNFLYAYFLNDFVWFLMASGVALSRLLILEARKERVALGEPTSQSRQDDTGLQMAPS